MIKIIPSLSFTAQCPHCRSKLNIKKIIWQGIHTCYEASCDNCNSEIIGDLPTGHATADSHQVDLKKKSYFC
jgi:hypothetical protein